MIKTALHLADDSPYRQQNIFISIKVNATYPFSAPVVKMETVVKHPNVMNDGTLCLDLL